MMNTYPKDIQLTINEDNYWCGMGKQDLSFHQVMGELVDNCISATQIDEDGDMEPFKIEIAIEKISDKIIIDIIDNGRGMSEEELIQNVFSPGGRGKSNGILNEHGFGLKNSLCVLTKGNKLNWNIITRDYQALENEIIYQVKGPFSSNINLGLTDINNMIKNGFFKINNTGTRVNVETTYKYFCTVYNRGKLFSTLIERFIEHLGVMYRSYLRSKHNKLIVRWKETLDTSSKWESVRVRPIEIYYDYDGNSEYEIDVQGNEGIAKAKYRVGKLDKEKTVAGDGEKPYPLKIYYQGNQQTQGVDLVVRGRVVKSSVLEAIWKTQPHNSMNKFVGEIILDDTRFRTINNKLGLDPNNDYTINLLEELETDTKYKVEKVTKSKTEEVLKKDFEIRLKGMFTGCSVQRERPIMTGSGVKVDVYLKESNNDITIYEFKVAVAAPIDVYQLLMYWDGVVKDEKQSPKKGRLVANEIPEAVRNIINDINQRLDGLGNKYNLEGKTIEEMGLEK
ncbi:hypothetical protein FC959_15740 [Clostridium botulinum]|nr:hypothetical protein [Clostridium botulinum]